MNPQIVDGSIVFTKEERSDKNLRAMSREAAHYCDSFWAIVLTLKSGIFWI